MYSHINYKLSFESYKNAIKLNLDNNQFIQAAKLQEKIGDMYLDDDEYDAKKAIEAYEMAAEYYTAENDDM